MSNKKYILDTDIGTDSDDIGALSILCNLARSKKLDILGVTVCNAQDDCALTVDVIAEHYGLAFPIGKAKSYGNDASHGTYARAIAMSYKARLKRGKIEQAVRVLRKILAENKNVSLVTIGPLTNIAELINSAPDDISPLCGKELIANIDEMFVMGGNFVENVSEWNILEDIKSAQTVINNITCPITFVPFEAGVNIFTARNLLANGPTPMQLGYYVHNITERNSWDPLTVYCAMVECLPTSKWGRVQIDDDGKTTFDATKDGKHRYVLNALDIETIQQKLEELMVN